MAGKALQPLPLGRRIFLKLGLVILLWVFSIQLVAFMCMRSSLRGSFRRNAEVSSALLALQTKEALQAKVPGQLDELLRSAKNSEPDILYLVAFDAEGEVLSAEGDSSYIKDFELSVESSGEQHTGHAHSFEGQVLHVIHPLDGGKAGCLHMGLSWEPVDHALKSVCVNMALVTLFGLALAGAVAWTYFCRMTRPMVDLIQTVREFGAGKLSARVGRRPRAEDEAALLASVFNQMADQLERQVGDLIRAKGELADEKARAQSIVNSMTQSVTLADREGRIAYCNRTAKRFCRRECDCANRMYAFHRANWPDAVSAFKEVAGGTASFRRLQRHVDGRDLELVMVPALDSDGAPLGVVEIVTDTTERLSSWRSLAHAEKLNVVGQLAAGVAHEINSPLDGAIEASRIIERSLQEPAKARHFCEAQRSALERIALIVRRLLTFSRAPSHTSWTVVQVSRLLEESQALLRHRLAKLKLEMPPTADTAYQVRGDELGLVQVLVNLLNNAIDVTPEKGRVRVVVELRESGRVAISVIDQGPGVSDEAARKLFTPFFTTKEQGKGTGLGLAVSRNIVQEHGGDIEFENLGSPLGARFTVTLPVEMPVASGEKQHAVQRAERECPVTA